MTPGQNSHTQENITAAYTITDMLAALLRGKWIIVTTFIVVLITVAVLTFLTVPEFESTASVLIDTKQSPSALFQDARTLITNINLMQNELEILASHSLATEVAQRLIEKEFVDPARTIPILIIQPEEDDTTGAKTAPLPKIVFRLNLVMSFEAMRESDVIKITASSPNNKEAALLANTWAEVYNERNVYISRSKSRSFREFLGEQMSEKQDALSSAEDNVREYAQRTGVVSLDDEARTVIDQVSTLEASRDEADIEIQSLLRTLASYQAQISEQEKNAAKMLGGASDPYIKLLSDQLAKLKVERDLIITQNKSLANSPVYITRLNQIDMQIKDLEGQLQERTDEFISTVLPATADASMRDDPTGYLKEVKQKFIQTQISINSLQARRDALNKAIREYEKRFERIPDRGLQYARLQRDKMSLEKLYLLLEEKYNEANVKEQSEFGYIDIFDRAVPSPIPSSPNVLLNLALGVVLGCGLGLALVFVKETLTARFHSPEDLHRRGYLPLTTINSMDDELKNLKKKGGAKGLRIDPRLITVSSPYSTVAESFRHLRNCVLNPRIGEMPKTLLLTSVEPGDGKTTISANFVVSLAQTGKKVLLIDGDLREPAAHSLFAFDQAPGLVQLLAGSVPFERAVRIAEDVPNLHVLTSGGPPPNPAELVGSEDMRFLISTLREEYDLIVIDSPPVLAVSDAAVLSTIVDGVLLVVCSGKTRAASLERATRTLDEVSAKVIGMILNKFDAKLAYGILYGGSGFGYYGSASRYGVQGNGSTESRKQEAKI